MKKSNQYILLGLINQIGHTCQFYFLAEELSTIPLHLKTIYQHRPRLYKLFSYLFAVSFIVSRLIYGTVIFVYTFRAVPELYQLASNAGDTNSMMSICLQAVLCILTRLLNIYWTILIIRKFCESRESKEK